MTSHPPHPPPDRPPNVAVFGPTASGKSEVGLLLAERLGGQVISCDSMLVYRGLDIGTAKPALADRQRVVHHLVDILDIEAPWDANRFVEAARDILGDLHRRRIPAILVGGTGLYAKALLYGLRLAPTDPDLHAELAAAIARGESAALQAELGRFVTPERAARIAENPRHLARAVEVARLTRRAPLGSVQAACEAEPGWLQFVLFPERDSHRRAVEQRTRAMLAGGWIEETQGLVARGLLNTPTARQALGYRDIAESLAGGTGDRESLVERLVIRTWQYARRQRTWFRHQHPGAYPIPLRAGAPPAAVAEALVSLAVVRGARDR